MEQEEEEEEERDDDETSKILIPLKLEELVHIYGQDQDFLNAFENYRAFIGSIGSTDYELKKAKEEFNLRSSIMAEKIANVVGDQGVDDLKVEMGKLRSETISNYELMAQSVNELKSFVEEKSPPFLTVMEVKSKVTTLESDIVSLRSRIGEVETKRTSEVNIRIAIFSVVSAIVGGCLGTIFTAAVSYFLN